MLDPTNGEEAFMGIKIEPKPIPDNWKTHYGNYKVKPSKYTCVKCPEIIDFNTTKLKVAETDGFVSLTSSNNEFLGDLTYILNILSENRAVTYGIGRQSGNTVRLLENGNIYFYGFEFERE